MAEPGRGIWAWVIFAGMALLAAGWLLPFAGHTSQPSGTGYLFIAPRFPWITLSILALFKLGLLALAAFWVRRKGAHPMVAGLVLGVALYEADVWLRAGPAGAWRFMQLEPRAGGYFWAAGIAILALASIGIARESGKVDGRSVAPVRVAALLLLVATGIYVMLDLTELPTGGHSLAVFWRAVLMGPISPTFWAVIRYVLVAAVLLPVAVTRGIGNGGAFLRGAALGFAMIAAPAAVVRALIWGVIIYPPPDDVVVAHATMMLVALGLVATILRSGKTAASTP